MHRWLLVVLVLLLPLRGLAGGVLAGQMLEQHLAVAGTAAAVHAAPSDCEGHRAAPADEGAPATPDTGSCASCQVCSAAALAPTVDLLAGPPLRQGAPEREVHGHASTEPELAFKPPRA
ncbi:hypothetical protein [Ramlibacter pallidus]|uniref:DUF2946 domain-containing protein n=1 Tax=Ramlibacter pallidus TaxID=2780087 RepID=A0ABR9SA00_9BURK|nr:hypothetical protein [Ramlibacter pallidus]MBE7370102.1 hypothetical protein [Ramlibacter pallidus]